MSAMREQDSQIRLMTCYSDWDGIIPSTFALWLIHVHVPDESSVYRITLLQLEKWCTHMYPSNIYHSILFISVSVSVSVYLGMSVSLSVCLYLHVCSCTPTSYVYVHVYVYHRLLK